MLLGSITLRTVNKEQIHKMLGLLFSFQLDFFEIKNQKPIKSVEF